MKKQVIMNRYFSGITDKKRWAHEADKILKTSEFSQHFILSFHTAWTVSGHHIREQVSDDKKLSELLRHLLPRYCGEGMTLYRGENRERWRKNEIGFCWSESREIAEMFGSGLNAIFSGGLLLSCKCKSEWIIAGPSKHSTYLGESEYTLDPSKLSNICILSEYSRA